MKAARLHEYGTSLALDEVPSPRPGPGGVVVRVDASGFSHRELHVIDGAVHVVPHLPITPGHENAGIVAAIGAGVSRVREGDPVAVFGAWGCDRCDYCLAGHHQLCEAPQWAGLSKYDGGFADYLLVPHERYLVGLTTLTPARAAPLTGAALASYHAIAKALPLIDLDDYALLIGFGARGEYALTLLRALCGCPVIVVDLSPAKLQFALELGAGHALDGRSPDLAARIRDVTRGRGVSASFDFVGTDATLKLALGATRSLGKVSQIGRAGGTARINVLENTRAEVLFEATSGGTLDELREIVALAESGRLAPIPLEFAPLDQINDISARVRGGEVQGRAVITPAPHDRRRGAGTPERGRRFSDLPDAPQPAPAARCAPR